MGDRNSKPTNPLSAQSKPTSVPLVIEQPKSPAVSLPKLRRRQIESPDISSPKPWDPKIPVKSSIDVHHGDLATTRTDVIVVCSSSDVLRENILKAGGDSIRTAYDTQLKDNSANSLIIVATNNQLPSQQIYFLPWKHNKDDNAFRNSLKTFVSTAIEHAVAANYQSIAFPAIGCGKFGCSVSSVAEAMVKEARQQIVKHPISISFIIQPGGANIYDEFQKQIGLSQQNEASSDTKKKSMTIGNATINVVIGDITKEQVDVIVASASSSVLRELILNAAGDEVRQAYNTQIKNNPNALLIVTSSGQLSCKRIFFVQWKPHTDELLLQQSIIDFIWNVIQNAISYGCTSIAFPAIGCGKYACSVDIVVKTMVNEVKKEIKNRKLAFKVRFVIQAGQKNVYDEFCKQILVSDACEKSIDHALPATWVLSTKNETRVMVSNTTDEYKTILTNFHASMEGNDKKIIKIERIQNQRWYKQYSAHSEDFRTRLQQDTEKRLYHGCDEEAAKSIVVDCFNRSFAGKNGTAYGVGVYFSSKAAYSHGYAVPNANGERFMFVSRVLIGKTTRGNGTMKTRPVGFDSTTDGNHIFVTYHDAQAFAEYLITYK